jgi:excinuclease UvrABC nuclease subunit
MGKRMTQISGTFQPPDILQGRIDFDPAGDLEVFVRQAPAKWAVYLMADADGRPLQLLCVKNLRDSLRRRLSGEQSIVLSKRVDYRQIVRQVLWRRVDSAFEADWIYYEVARQIFPGTYQGMVGFRPAWFVHVNPDAPFPRYTKTIDLSPKAGIHLGPLEDKHVAGKLIELVQDWFDLCRYYNILIEAPHGRACPYKEMGKCPAPCDGSISMEQYRWMIRWSTQTLADPEEFIRDQTRRMEQAAEEMRYETAGKIKAFVQQVSQIGKGPFRHLRKLNDFAFVTLQMGPRPGTAKIFVIGAGWIEEIANLINEPQRPADLLRTILTAANPSQSALNTQGAERIGIVAHHLFQSRQTHGVFIPLADISEPAILKAYRDLRKQKPQEDSAGEGVMKELQAM